MWKGLILLGLLLVGCSSDPAVNQATHDRAVAELRAEIHAARDMVKDQTAINTSLTEKNEELVAARAEDLKEIANLEKKVDKLSNQINNEMDDLGKSLSSVDALKTKIAQLSREVIIHEYPVTVEEGFKDIFDNATKVDRFGVNDLLTCSAESTYQAQAGDKITVEVAYARRLYDGSGYDLRNKNDFLEPEVRLIYPDSEGYKKENGIGLRLRTYEHSEDNPNLWMENEETTPYLVGILEGKRELRKVSLNDDGPGVGEYKVVFQDRSQECARLVDNWGMNLIVPDSILVAWYVD